MALAAAPGLNVSGEPGLTRMFSRGALHLSCGQRTSTHAHYAWKLHLGLDAPVWVDSPQLKVPPSAGARALLVPPNFTHATGAVGCSLAVFMAPGTRGAPWRDDGRPRVLEQRQVDRLMSVGVLDEDRTGGGVFVEHLARELFPHAISEIDSRVAFCLRRLHEDPDHKLSWLARETGVSLDHLSRLVRRETGLVLRRHVLWSRLLRALAQPPGSLASAAVGAGFSDHAHLTRTFRACLGRVPSEFDAPPQIVAPW